MSSSTNDEGQIREAMIKGDVVEVMIALPGKLFLNTQIPVCLWFMTNDKTKNGRDRSGEVLFIDARQLGEMKTRVLRIFTDEDIAKLANIVQAWKLGDDYEDIAGFCKSASLEEIEKNGFALMPGRYVGVEVIEDDDVPFKERFASLQKNLDEQFIRSEQLALTVREKLNRILIDE